MFTTVEHAGHNAGTVTTAGQTTFFPLGDALVASNTTESNRSVTYRKVGTAYQMFIRVQASSTTTASTFTLRKNTADSSLTLSMAAAATGTFLDASDSVPYNSGSNDTLAFKHITAATGTQTLHAYGMVVTDINDGRYFYNTAGTTAITAANTTNFIPIGGRNGTSAAVAESAAQATMRITGSFDSMHVLVGTNARTSTTTFSSRKNTAAGNLTVSFTSLQTGRQEDLARADNVVSGDLYCFTSVTSTSTLTLNLDQIGAITKTTNGTYMPTCPANGGVVVTTASTSLFAKLQGSLTSATAGSAWDTGGESAHQVPVYSPVKIEKIGIRVSANARPTSTLTLRQNGVSTSVVASITASTTGLFEDPSNTVTVVYGDLVGAMLTTGTGTNSTTFQVMQSLWTDLTPTTDLNKVSWVAMQRASIY